MGGGWKEEADSDEEACGTFVALIEVACDFTVRRMEVNMTMHGPTISEQL